MKDGIREVFRIFNTWSSNIPSSVHRAGIGGAWKKGVDQQHTNRYPKPKMLNDDRYVDAELS